MPGNESIAQIRDSLLPNRIYPHPRVEIISDEGWRLVATFHDECVFYEVMVQHTEDGDGVIFSYKDDSEDIDAFGPYFGDNPVPNANVVPVSRFSRRARPRHLFAKLDPEWHVPDQSAQPREHGPLVKVEEWYTIDKEGQTDESKSMAGARTSQDSYLVTLEAEQKKMELEIQREEASNGGS